MTLIASLPPVVQRLLCSCYVFPALVVDFCVVWLLQVLYLVLSFPFVSAEQRSDTCGRIFRYISYLLIDRFNPFWHIHLLNEFPRGLHREADTPTKKIILMMNHTSSADPFLAIRAFLPRDGTWIAKAALFLVPIGGWSMANSDDLPVYFVDKHKHRHKQKMGAVPAAEATKPSSPAARTPEAADNEEITATFVNSFALVPGTVGPMMERARAKLRRGRMLCVFPEGTRSEHANRPYYLEPFRQGFFDLAVEEGATIVPMAISGTHRAWPRGSILMQPAHCYLSYGNVIEASKFSSAVELAAAVRSELLRVRETHPDRLGTGPL